VSEVFPAALDQAQDAYKNETIFFTLRSLSTGNFTTALVQNAFEDETLTGLAQNKIRVKGIKLIAMQNLDYELRFFQKTLMRSGAMDTDSDAGSVYFDALLGKQDAGASFYYYYNGSMDLIYENLDGTYAMDVSLINRSAVAKIIGAPGYVVAIFDYEPCS
jgi:hypothetical protein